MNFQCEIIKFCLQRPHLKVKADHLFDEIVFLGIEKAILRLSTVIAKIKNIVAMQLKS